MSQWVTSTLSSRREALILAALAVVFCATHLPFLNRTPGTVDAVNLLLGVEDFNLLDHRPHPPGYPIVIGLGKLSQLALDRIDPVGPADSVRALALWSAVFGTAAPIVLFCFFRSLDGEPRLATAAAALTVTCPLFWFNASRPMTDIPGLVACVAAQALLLTAWKRQQAWIVLAGATAAGISIGFRIQNASLTLPLLLFVVLQGRPFLRTAAHAAAGWSAGVFVWAVPLLLAVGGPAAYVTALRSQGGADLAGADILATNHTVERLLAGLIHTFAYPWANTMMAAATLVPGLIGAVTMRTGSRSVAVALAICTLPYAVFHLMFQESVHVRYALPLLPAMAYLTVRGLHALSPHLMPWLVVGLSMAGIAIAFPAVVAYAQTGSPSFQALEDIRKTTSAGSTSHVLVAHHAVSRVLRGAQIPVPVLPVAPKHEWLALLKHWQEKPDVPVWFLAEAGRSDLALLDRHSRRLMRSYRWQFRRKFLMSRTPADGLDWYEISAPGWIAGEGWSLTPESTGVASQDGRGPANGGIVALARQRNEDAILMVGGRNTSGPAGPTAHFELSIAGRLLDTWQVEAGSPFFLRMVRVPAGTLTAPTTYVPVTLRAHAAAADGRALAVAVEQFDLQTTNTPVYGFDSGWYEPEFDGAAPAPWRWTAPVAVVRVHHGGRDLSLRMTGEVSLDQFSRAPLISVRAGESLLAEIRPPDSRFSIYTSVPAAVLDRADGVLRIETDQSFVPHDALRNGDRRRVSLRIYDFDLRSDEKKAASSGRAPDYRLPLRLAPNH